MSIITAKQFAAQLNQTLDELGAPINNKERTTVLSKMLDIPRQQAWNLLEGHVLPENELLEKVMNELEINVEGR